MVEFAEKSKTKMKKWFVLTSPNRTWPRFSVGDLRLPSGSQKSKAEYSKGITLSCDVSRLTNRSILDFYGSFFVKFSTTLELRPRAECY